MQGLRSDEYQILPECTEHEVEGMVRLQNRSDEREQAREMLDLLLESFPDSSMMIAIVEYPETACTPSPNCPVEFA